jgi:predicted permease
MAWMNRLWNLIRSRRLDRGLEEELTFHIEARTRDNIDGGMRPAAAHRDALRRFGNRTLATERTREMNTIAWLETIGQDVRYAVRSLRKSPAFTAVALLAMALGIGANTAVFTVVNGVLLRPLPFSQPERLFLISYKLQRGPFVGGPCLLDQHYFEFERRNQSFERVATFDQNAVTLTGAGDATRLSAATATASFFRVLQVNPAMGRSFLQEEEWPGSNVVVLSDKLWRDRFGRDPSILGKTVTLDGKAYNVIGIMPPGFAFPTDTELWLPLAMRADPGNAYFRPSFGRLRPSVSREQAQAELEAFVQHLPGPKVGMVAEILPLKDLLVEPIRKSLFIFLGAVGFVLLIACANVANLLLMRGASRRQEMAVRTALGARRGRLIRQLLTESMLLSLGGAAAGILLALAGVPALLTLAPAGRVPRLEEIRFDGHVLAFALSLGMLTGVLFGLAPAFEVAGRGLRDFLAHSGRTVTGRRERLRSSLVISEIALALVLLNGAGLMLKSFLRIRAVNPGFRADNLLTATVDLPATMYRTTTALQAFHRSVLERLSRLPGVTSAAAVNWLPLGPALIRGDFHSEGRRPMPPDYIVDKPAVSPEYFHVMGIPIQRGRGFTEQDNRRAPGVVVISQSVARTLWPGANPIGKRITLEDEPKPEDWLTIIGTVDDVRQQSLTEQPHPAIYQPYEQVKRAFFLSHMTFAARTAINPGSVAAAMRSVLRQVDRSQPVQIAAMTDLISATTAEPWFQARLISIFSILALLLAGVGTYGVLAFAVAERTREIGIRMALGASKSDVTRMVVKRSLLLVVAGVALGTAGAVAVTRVLAKFLFDVKATDPATFVIVAVLLAGVGFLAGWLPGRCAGAMDPLIALRYE